ncbi:WD repeat-containing protein 90 [Lobulomyces angularis]|nr:WD repeat-containing protein 90 [Lobulomyces angularis]
MNRPSKIHEFVAHSSNVKCLKLGNKSGRILATGGEDNKVNIWAVGKSTPIMSLNGHSSAIDSVALDSQEEICVAGLSSGILKLWDLESAKIIRQLNGHKTSVNCLEFHPYGDFFASSDSECIKVWDVRRKASIQTYNCLTEASTIKITPDGKWIGFGSKDGSIKLWDMTAGKLLTSLNNHTESVVSIDFSPVEVSLFSVGLDGQMYLTDLQNFENVGLANISSCRDPSYPGIPKAATFHQSGKGIFIVLADGLQTWSWKSDILKCEDLLSTSWSNIKDLKILEEDNRLICASCDQNFVGLWGMNLNNLKVFQEERHHLSSSPLPLPKISRKTLSNANILNSREDIVEANIKSPNPLRKSSSGLKAVEKSNDSLSKVGNSYLKNFNQQNTPPQTLPKIEPIINYNQQGENFINSETINYNNIDNTKRKSSINDIHTEIPPVSKLTRDQDILDALSVTKFSTFTILKTRLQNLKIVKESWDESFEHGQINLRTSLETLILINDPAIWCDLLRIIVLQPKLINSLDLCEMLLPVLGELLFDSRQE